MKDELYRIPGEDGEWSVLVVSNAYPFAPIHEVVINSPEHDQGFATLSLGQIERVLEAYQHRYNEHAHKGQVIIFHNHGLAAGESLTHSHTQIAVIPERIPIDAPLLSSVLPQKEQFQMEYKSFSLLTPEISQWPDEVWIAPLRKGRTFGQISQKERSELAYLLKQLILLFDERYAKDFPYNFYIYPGEAWYLRLLPRQKTIGGFELATGVFVNTQKPLDTMAFIKEHLHAPDFEKIKEEQRATYHKAV
jgi:UDPglucose--hexose-1-phosphate uridylyltransferase